MTGAWNTVPRLALLVDMSAKHIERFEGLLGVLRESVDRLEPIGDGDDPVAAGHIRRLFREHDGGDTGVSAAAVVVSTRRSRPPAGR